jgi:hypothetical protein
MKIFDIFAKDKQPILDAEQVSTVDITDFWVLDGLKYNPNSISLETYRRMSKHYQVKAAIKTIGYSLQQIDWFIQADNETVRNIATYAIEKIWNRLIRGISKSFVYGFSPCVKVFTKEKINGKDYIVYKNIKDLKPSDCTVKVDKWGNYDGFYYRKGEPLYGKLVNSEYSFWYTNDMEDGNLYGQSLLEGVYKPWWYVEKLHQFANRYYERFGEPVSVGRYPTGAKVKDSSGALKGADVVMKNLVEGLKNHSSSTIPSDRDDKGNFLYDLSYLESQMRGYDFENYFKRLDMEIFRGVLVPGLMFGGESGGSYALGSAQMASFYTNLMGIMDNVVDYVNLYILPQIIEFNFEKSRKAKFTYQPLSADAKKNIQELIMQIIKAGKAKPDLSQLEERSGFKLSEDTPPAPKAIPVVKPKDETKKKEEAKLTKELEMKEIDLNNKEKELEKELADADELKKRLMELYD